MRSSARRGARSTAWALAAAGLALGGCSTLLAVSEQQERADATCVISGSVAADYPARGPLVVGPDCRIDADAVVGPGVVLGARCHVGPGAHLETAVLWEEVEVGVAARLAGCLLGRRSLVGAHAAVPPGAILGDDTRLTDYSRLTAD